MLENQINLDFERAERIGFGEAIFCLDKSVAQIAQIIESISYNETRSLFTRLSEDKFSALDTKHRCQLDYDPVSMTAFWGEAVKPFEDKKIAVISAGTSDISISKEALRTLAFHGQQAQEFNDVGVAGLWRLMERIEEIRRYPILIVVAGMDAALPTVIGGLVSGVIIAVPTDRGYGVCENGKTALYAMLASCSPGISVVNINNGYGAACASMRMINTAGIIVT